MLRKMVIALVCCMLVLVQLTGSPCKAEDAFDAALAEAMKLNPLPENPPAVLQLYQCQVLASFLQPGMQISDVKCYMEREHVQPIKITQTGIGDEMITTFYFSPYYQILMRGETIKSMSFQIATSEKGEAIATIPLSVQYTTHTVANETAEAKLILPQISRTKEEIDAHIQREIAKIKRLQYSNYSLFMPLVYEMMQYALFASVLYSGMPMEETLAYAQQIPVLTSSEQSIGDNDITWNWRDVIRGNMSFYCEFEDGQLLLAGFWVDHTRVANALALLPEGGHTFEYDYEITSGITGYIYTPTTYVDLTKTWIGQK